MPSDKDRLYIALYARGGEARMLGKEDKYHWSFIVAPKDPSPNATGRRFHAKEIMQNVNGKMMTVWAFEDREMSLLPTSAILVRVLIGKIVNKVRLQNIFATTPIRASTPGYEDWNCVSWVEEALGRAASDGSALGTSRTEWRFVRDTAMWYVEKKADEHRFDGMGNFDQSKVATWDALKGKEVIV